MHITARGLLAGSVALAAVLSLSTAADADRHAPVPSKADVDHARAEAHRKAGDVAAIQARLAVANDRLEATAQQAEVAAEQYNGAVYRLGEAKQKTKLATRAAQRAAEAVARQRSGIAALVTRSYQDGSVLNGLTAIMGGEDPATIMNRVGAVDSVGDAMQARFDRYTANRALARSTQARAEKAQADQAALTARAAHLKDSAAAAARGAQQEAARIAAERKQLIVELAGAQRISVSLAGRRQHALEEIAREKAARAAAARARAAAQRAAQEAAAQAARDAAAHASGGGRSGGAPSSGGSGGSGGSGSVATSAAAARAVAFARSQLGDPYLWAAAGPDAWDCSGLMMMAWRQGGVSLPHYSAAQYARTEHIGAGDLRPGDLVFWGSSPGTIHHVAMYLGNGQIIHAPRTGAPVRIDSMYYWIPPNYFGRP